MHPLVQFGQALSAAGVASGDVAIATVVAVRGSTPRHVGARMAVAADGTQWGTIGGGRIEHEVVQLARAVAAGGAGGRHTFHLTRDLAMCCGGTMDVVIAPAGALDALGAALEVAAAARRRTTLVTPLDGTPTVLGDDALAAGLTADALIEHVAPPERAVVFGAGHVGRALGPVLAATGWAVHLCDDDETGALAAGAPSWATSVIESFDVATVERALGGLGLGDYVLIVTRDHAVDQRVLEALIGRDELTYLGMIGSRGKVGRFRQRLAAKGLDRADFAQRLRAPIGLDIGAETPAEIAVAIAAELIAWRRRGPTAEVPGG